MYIFYTLTYNIDYSYKEIHLIMVELCYITEWTGTVSRAKETRILRNSEWREGLI